jgi:hypothetical protein
MQEEIPRAEARMDYNLRLVKGWIRFGRSFIIPGAVGTIGGSGTPLVEGSRRKDF